mmetsp:Transcript_5986/g.18549  ORF Transcript_5986/g.18549 Transcript_5986/m.18549 type:complete len:297 (-) Transcript_5986:840-1730(-)
MLRTVFGRALKRQRRNSASGSHSPPLSAQDTAATSAGPRPASRSRAASRSCRTGGHSSGLPGRCRPLRKPRRLTRVSASSRRPATWQTSSLASRAERPRRAWDKMDTSMERLTAVSSALPPLAATQKRPKRRSSWNCGPASASLSRSRASTASATRARGRSGATGCREELEGAGSSGTRERAASAAASLLEAAGASPVAAGAGGCGQKPQCEKRALRPAWLQYSASRGWLSIHIKPLERNTGAKAEAPAGPASAAPAASASASSPSSRVLPIACHACCHRLSSMTKRNLLKGRSAV